MKIPLKTIYSAAPNRAAGYVEEIKKRGKIQGSDVELSDSDFNYISENFKLGSKPKVEISKAIQEVKAKVESEVKVETKTDIAVSASSKVPEISQVLFR
jgi:hypothetical protein